MPTILFRLGRLLFWLGNVLGLSFFVFCFGVAFPALAYGLCRASFILVFRDYDFVPALDMLPLWLLPSFGVAALILFWFVELVICKGV